MKTSSLSLFQFPGGEQPRQSQSATEPARHQGSHFHRDIGPIGTAARLIVGLLLSGLIVWGIKLVLIVTQRSRDHRDPGFFRPYPPPTRRPHPGMDAEPGTNLWQAVLEAHFILAFNERTVGQRN